LEAVSTCSDSDYTIVRSADHRRMRWLNGGGWWPNQDDWEWRLSVADIEQDGPFSALPGVDRTIALLQGTGFGLSATGHPRKDIVRQYEPFDFRGDEPTSCTLIDGPVQDLNLMVRRTAAPRRLRFVEVVDAIELRSFEVAIVLSGRAHVGGHTLSRLDAILPNGGSRTVGRSLTSVESGTVGIVV
jgi:uncharacterized protein